MKKERLVTLDEKFVLRAYACTLVLGSVFFFGMLAEAATPNPGHAWASVGNGFWQVANTLTGVRSFTFPDGDANVVSTLGSVLASTIPYGNATSMLATSTAGVGGQIFSISGGIPTWVATSTLALPGKFIGTRVLSGTTYTPTTGTNTIIVRLIGGGGGGGGATAAASATAVASGGGGGSYAEKKFTNILGAATYTIALGAGGTAGVAANGTGGTGGSTTFACPATCTGGAVTVTAPGGAGGISTASGTTAASTLGGAGGAVPTNGDLNTIGQPGEGALRFSGTVAQAGSGGPSYLLSGALGINTAGSGALGSSGAGGSGALSTTASGFAGAAGGAGVILVYEFR